MTNGFFDSHHDVWKVIGVLRLLHLPYSATVEIAAERICYVLADGREALLGLAGRFTATDE